MVNQGGAPLGIVGTRGTIYLKVSAGFLKAQHQPASLCTLLCGKYIKTSASRAAPLLSTFKLTRFVSAAFTRFPTAASAFRGVTFRQSTSGGQAALCTTNGGYTICLASHGTPYLLQISTKSGTEAFRFSQWNKVAAIQAPPKSQIIDGRRLGL